MTYDPGHEAPTGSSAGPLQPSPAAPPAGYQPSAYPPPANQPPANQPPADQAPVQPPGAGRPTAGLTSRGKVRTTRLSALWIGLIVAAILLIALLIFVAQNSRTVTIHFLGWHGHLSLAVALLLAAVIGVLLVAIPGTARILQLRRALRKNAAAR
jgi:uncharacterized integral membrane protein